jgi:hypothetical protein
VLLGGGATLHFAQFSNAWGLLGFESGVPIIGGQVANTRRIHNTLRTHVLFIVFRFAFLGFMHRTLLISTFSDYQKTRTFVSNKFSDFSNRGTNAPNKFSFFLKSENIVLAIHHSAICCLHYFINKIRIRKQGVSIRSRMWNSPTNGFQ